MVMPPPVGLPTPEEVATALADFTRTVQAVTQHRAQAFGPGWIVNAEGLGDAAVADAQQIADDTDFIRGLQREIDESPAAYRILWAELYAVNYLHRRLSGLEFDEELPPVFVDSQDEADPLSERAVKDLETVQGSIEKIINRLPPWLKKLMEALMEMLKLSRGIVG